MCGIAGYSLSSESTVDRTLSAQALLAGIAERGADAVGVAHRLARRAEVVLHKQQTGASALLDVLLMPSATAQALVHVRDYTKGHPTILANNHPIRHGTVVGIHNGIVENDDELFDRHAIERAEPGMTVDSEAIFALVHAYGSEPSVLEELHGAVAAAWADERQPESVWLARGLGRPLWLGRGKHELFFASTRDALEVVERTLRIGLCKAEVHEGRLLRVADGRVAGELRWSPDRSYRERHALPSVRAPHEGASCLERLAVIAALA